MTTAEANLQAARRRLHETLSGRQQPKLNAAPDETSAGYKVFAAIVKRNAAAQERLNLCKKEMVLTLSSGKKSDGFDDGVLIAEVPADQIVKQAAAKKEMHQRLAGTYQKRNQCPLDDDEDNSGGKSNVTLDSPITPSGTPFVGKYGYITARGGTITLDQLLAEEESADEDSPSPAVVSGETEGQSDWSPSDHQDTENDADDDNDAEFDPAAESADIIAMYTSANGRINKHAAKHFLTVSGDGTTSPSQYAVPLSRMNKLSNQPEYFDKALDEAFDIAAGKNSGLANYGKMSRVIRINQRNKIPLTAEQKDHVIRHMAAVEPTAAERDAASIGRTT